MYLIDAETPLYVTHNDNYQLTEAGAKFVIILLFKGDDCHAALPAGIPQLSIDPCDQHLSCTLSKTII